MRLPLLPLQAPIPSASIDLSTSLPSPKAANPIRSPKSKRRTYTQRLLPRMFGKPSLAFNTDRQNATAPAGKPYPRLWPSHHFDLWCRCRDGRAGRTSYAFSALNSYPVRVTGVWPIHVTPMPHPGGPDVSGGGTHLQERCLSANPVPTRSHTLSGFRFSRGRSCRRLPTVGQQRRHERSMQDGPRSRVA